MSSKRKKKQTFNVFWILVICILPVIAAWILIPRDLEMAERFAEDGHSARALGLIREIIPPELIDQNKKEDWELPAVEALLTSDNKVKNRGGKKTRMIRILIQLSEDPDAAYHLLSKNHRRLEATTARDLYEILATTALRQNNPGLASKIYLDLDRTHGLAENQVMKAIESCRFSGSPRPALELLEVHANNQGLTVSQLPRDLRMLVISLHRELNEGAKAFELLKIEFERAKSQTERTELIDLLATTAAQSNMFAESLPILIDHLHKTEADQMSWQDLAKRPTPHATDKDFTKYGTTLAQQYLWSGKLDMSFELYRKLAILNQGEALENCVMITPWINRPGELGDLLASIDPLPQGMGYEDLLVESLSIGGNFEEAETRLRNWISGDHPEAGKMKKALADLAFELRRYDEANDLYAEAEVSNPEDIDTLVNLASNSAIIGNYEQALSHYRKIPIEKLNVESIGDYLMLASSMNATADIQRALDAELRLGKHTNPSELYMSKAHAFEAVGNLDEALNCLKVGREKHPDSRKIILEIVEVHRKRGRHHDALEYLFAHYHRDDYRFHSRILDLAVSTKRHGEVLKFLRLTDPLATDWPAALRLALASVYESNLNYETALVLYENVSPDGFTSPKNRLRAQIAYRKGNLEEAWQLQQEYLKSIPRPSHSELVFMGDLHRFTGRSKDATKAYTAALTNLNRTIHLDSANMVFRGGASNM